MKKTILLICCFVLVILLAGCAGSEGEVLKAGTATQTPAPPVTSTSTPAPPSPTPTKTLRPSRVVTSTVTLTPFPSEARVTAQCVSKPDDSVSSGIVILTEWDMFYTEECFDAYSIDMTTWKRTQISAPDAIHAYFYVSPGREFYTYRYWSLEDFRNGPIHRYLVISDAKGNALRTIPWGDNWFDLIGWLDDRRLLFRLAPTIEDVDLPLKPRRLLVFDPFSGERWLLRPDLLPEVIDVDFSTFEATSWFDWHGGLYDHTLTRVIYPRIIDEENSLYTYSLFDLSLQQTVSDLETIINSFAGIDYYPKPDWSPDVSQFVVVGGVANKDSGELTGRELYRVTRDGQVEQMTHLGDSAYIVDSSHSWSPDGRYIALFLSPVDGLDHKASLAVLDTETLEIIDYCVEVEVSDEWFEGWPPAPIWSPDGTQLLVVDQQELYSSQVIWVDLENGVAARLGKDKGAAGWMLASEE